MTDMLDYLTYTFEDTPEFIDTFDELPFWSAPFGRMLLDRIDLRGLRAVLDVGCGAGFPILELAERLGAGCTVYGVDPWRNALDRLERKIAAYGITNVKVIEGKGENVPLAAGSIDLIVSNLGINNVDDPRLLYTECHRLLRNGGRLAVTTNLSGHWHEFYEVFRASLASLGRNDLVAAVEEHERHRGTVASIRASMEEMGFSVERTHEETFPMRFLDGSAFLRHHFIRLGFLGTWKGIIPEGVHEEVFARIEEDLNRYASERGELRLTVPMAFVEGVKGERI
jgi:arsenite methyltransferase